MSRQLRIIWLLFSISIISTVLHNFFYAIFKFEDAIFFILSILCFFILIGYLIYNIYTKITKKQPKDLWIVGFVGIVLAILFLIVGVNNPILYIIPGLFGLFFIFRWV
ncbi:hypothetical protein HOD38_00050 [archaeon]|jgi:hypothetical protein|nr:hypothetical protein [archaeon]MBT4396638.1 hypothetical protein [archaeon]MBT4441248.1 hypothetical protein [archaeon]